MAYDSCWCGVSQGIEPRVAISACTSCCAVKHWPGCTSSTEISTGLGASALLPENQLQPVRQTTVVPAPMAYPIAEPTRRTVRRCSASATAFTPVGRPSDTLPGGSVPDEPTSRGADQASGERPISLRSAHRG